MNAGEMNGAPPIPVRIGPQLHRRRGYDEPLAIDNPDQRVQAIGPSQWRQRGGQSLSGITTKLAASDLRRRAIFLPAPAARSDCRPVLPVAHSTTRP